MWYAWHIRCGDQDQDVPVYPVTAGGGAADGYRLPIFFTFNSTMLGAKKTFAPGIN